MLGLTIDVKQVSAAILSDGGDFVCVDNAPTPPDSYRDCLLAIQQLVTKIAPDHTSPIGVAIPANLRDDMVSASSLGYLNGKPLARDLQASLGREVRLQNSGHCFTRYEAQHLAPLNGSGPVPSVFGMVIDTACHGGLSINGQIVAGSNGITGNWAHMPLPSPVPYELDGQECWCGRTGCLETFLSAAGLEDDYYKITETRLSALDIAAAAANNDIVAESALQVLEDRIGRATAAIINLIDPDVIVLGGMVGALPRLVDNVPRKWPGYVISKKPATRLQSTIDSTQSILGGAALLAV